VKGSSGSERDLVEVLCQQFTGGIEEHREKSQDRIDSNRTLARELLLHQTARFNLSPFLLIVEIKLKKTKLRGLSPRANYTDRATAACQRS
jgi:hypothetical protein